MPDTPPTADPAPIFLVGAERSGTTLLRLMLAAHPELAVLSEFEYVVDPLAPHPHHGKPGDPPPPAERLRERLDGDVIFGYHHEEFGLDLPAGLGYRELAHHLLHQVRAAKPDAAAVVAVVHRHIDQLPRLWQAGRYVHIVRDPRDVARSNIGMGWAGNVYHGVERWLEVERQWDRLRATLDEGGYLELRQEDLIHEPEATLTGLCRFCGVDYTDEMMSYAGASTYEKPDPSLTEQWRRKLTPRQIGLVEARAGALMMARGYELSGHPPVTPGPLGRARLRAGDKLGTLRHRVGVSGAGLFVQDVVSRKLGIESWQRALRPKLEERFKAAHR